MSPVAQAVRLASTDARDLVPRLLQLLMVEPKGAETLGRAVAQKAADLPGWIWLPWVPQLMTSLQRPEVAVARRILSAAAGAFPQQLYWHVRPGMLAMKDAAVKAVQDAKAQVRYCNLSPTAPFVWLCGGRAQTVASAVLYRPVHGRPLQQPLLHSRRAQQRGSQHLLVQPVSSKTRTAHRHPRSRSPSRCVACVISTVKVAICA